MGSVVYNSEVDPPFLTTSSIQQSNASSSLGTVFLLIPHSFYINRLETYKAPPLTLSSCWIEILKLRTAKGVGGYASPDPG